MSYDLLLCPVMQNLLLFSRGWPSGATSCRPLLKYMVTPREKWPVIITFALYSTPAPAPIVECKMETIKSNREEIKFIQNLKQINQKNV